MDGHRDYVRGASHTAHVLFVKTLLTPGAIAPIPRGPSSAAKKTKKATPKRSAKLKRMLAPPPLAGPVGKKQKNMDVVLTQETLQELLPGMVDGAAQRPILESIAQGKETLCLATTGAGRRCKRARSAGSFCSRHFDMAAGQKHISQLYDTVKAPAENAMSAWEKSQVELAIELSQAESQELRQQEERSNEVLDARCAARGLKRVCVPPLANCLFEAIVHAAMVPLTAKQLRLAVVDYLRPLGRLFGPSMESRFAGRYQDYCDQMSRDGVWGDQLCLVAAAHILPRPIWVITDSAAVEESGYISKICPPPIIAESTWGPQITVTARMDKHFDSTEELQS